MTETVTPPPEEASAGESSVQRPLGPYYLWNGTRTEVVHVESWEGDAPLITYFGSELPGRLGSDERLLNPVPMPPPGDPGPLGDRVGPTQALSDLIRDAYSSGVVAERTGLPSRFQEMSQCHLLDRAVATLGAMFATGGRPLNTRGRNLLGLTSVIVDRAFRAGIARSGSDDGPVERLLQEEVGGLIDVSLLELEPLIERANPHHPTERLRTYSHEDFVSWVGENASLRRHLLWVAGRAEVTSETRRLLAERIRSGSDAVVADQAEDDHRQVLDFRRLVEEVCETVDAALEAKIPELTRSDCDQRPGRLPMYWNGRAEDRARALRSALEDLPEIETLAGIRFA